MRPFVEDCRNAMALKCRSVHAILLHIAIHAGIVHAQYVVDFFALLLCQSRVAVYHRAGGVGALQVFVTCLEVAAVGTLVAYAPEEHGRVMLKVALHLVHLAQIFIAEGRVVARSARSIVALAMSVDKAHCRFTFHIYAISVAEFHKTLAWRIV